MSVFMTQMWPDRELADHPLARTITLYASLLARRALPGGPEIQLNVLFPGKFNAPGFTGMQLVRYEHKTPTVHLQVAVPPRILDMTDPSAYVGAVLRDAIDAADEFLDEMDVRADTDSLMALVDAVDDEVTQQRRTGRRPSDPLDEYTLNLPVA